MAEQTPTQVQHPNRTAWRTAVQVAVAVITVIPYVVADLNMPIEGVLAQVVAVAAGVSRVMAIPQVAKLIREHFPWLAPVPGARDTPGHDGAPGEAPRAHGGTVAQ